MHRIDDIACPQDCACGDCRKILRRGEPAAQWVAEDGESILAYWHVHCADRQDAQEAQGALEDQERLKLGLPLQHNAEAEAAADLAFRRLRHNDN
jgi:hypothetical protein